MRAVCSPLDTGSSPRMRGALFPPVSWPKAPRIIPADAGSTLCVDWYDSMDWDHPRGCGEHFFKNSFYRQSEGSSPRMRGALFRFHEDRSCSGIIPADAGSTLMANPACLTR